MTLPDGDGGPVTDLCIHPDQFQRVFAADVPAEVADLIVVTQRPITSDALEDKAEEAAWRSSPSSRW